MGDDKQRDLESLTWHPECGDCHASASVDLFSQCSLSAQQKRLWELALAADLEGAEVLVPKTFGSFGFTLAPEFQCVNVLDRDFSLACAIK